MSQFNVLLVAVAFAGKCSTIVESDNGLDNYAFHLECDQDVQKVVVEETSINGQLVDDLRFLIHRNGDQLLPGQTYIFARNQQSLEERGPVAALVFGVENNTGARSQHRVQPFSA